DEHNRAADCAGFGYGAREIPALGRDSVPRRGAHDRNGHQQGAGTLPTPRHLGIAGEVGVADNGSTDGSQAVAGERGARVVPVAEPGYGSALTGGIAAARGRWVVMGDADDSYDFSDLEPFVERLRDGYDLVNGNRFEGGIKPGAMPWLHRHLGNPVLSFVGRRLYGTPCGDIYCGLRGFDREKVIALDLPSSGLAFEIEMIVKATMLGLRVTEVPTTLSPDAEDREAHLRTWL